MKVFDIFFSFSLVGEGKWWYKLSSIQLFYISLSLFVPEAVGHVEQIDDFAILAHNPDASEISSNIKKLLSEKKNNIEVYRGPHQKSYVGEAKYTVYFQKYFETLIYEDPQVLPWKILMNSRDSQAP